MNQLAGNGAENQLIGSVALQNAGQRITVLQFDIPGEVVRIDRGIGRGDIAQNGSVIAEDKIREIGSDVSALAPNTVTFVTGNLIVKENSFAVQPIAASQLGNLARCSV